MAEPEPLVSAADEVRIKFHRLEAAKQTRLDVLMAKNNDGRMTAAEKDELKILVREAEELTLRNARLLQPVPQKPDATNSSDEPLAYLNGHLLRVADARLPLHDAGFVFGATVTDFCRTVRHQLFRLDDHLARFRSSCQAARIPQPRPDAELADVAHQLVAHNAAQLPADDDLALVLFATPGPLGAYAGLDYDGPPTLGMHIFPLQWARYRRLFTEGARLVIPATRHTAPDCVDPHIKQRSRLNWWIASQEAQDIEPGSWALLLGPDGGVTETAAANFLIVRGGTVVSPPRATVLDGVSLRVTEDLCRDLGIPFAESPLSVADCLAADEALLTGTAFCLAGVRSINGRTLPWPGPLSLALMTAWERLVGMDYRGQIVSIR